ncbi:helix-turn-helix domain-containing protein [Gallaecimonas mangrovi]|uniref:helix-turn-helix domain-containing protein n=1 Tax=Gallaecimonas mangrovi TaxID=2291597 RepID=UPI000E20A733|nr:helix-turn-helix domain-containing protein [Gallaecimonas mangrovi]
MTVSEKITSVDFDEWAHLISDTYVPVSCENKSNQPVSGFVSSKSLGAMTGAHYNCSVPMRYARRDSHIENDSTDDYQIMLLNTGIARVEQEGRQVELISGDVVFYKASAPFELDFLSEHQTTVIKVPSRIIACGRPEIQHLTAISLAGTSPHGRFGGNAIKDMMRNHSAENGDPLIEETLLSFLYAAVNQRQPTHSGHDKKLHDIKAYIERHLEDTSLSAAQVANVFGVSVRTVNRLFSERATTFNTWLWFKRTERCFNILKENKSNKVIDVIFECGFSDISHFYRLFKKYYSRTPASLHH